MITITRRKAMIGLAALCAPAIIRTPGLIMPIKPLRFVHVTGRTVTWTAGERYFVGQRVVGPHHSFSIIADDIAGDEISIKVGEDFEITWDGERMA